MRHIYDNNTPIGRVDLMRADRLANRFLRKHDPQDQADGFAGEQIVVPGHPQYEPGVS
jgi:hypothetical protein